MIRPLVPVAVALMVGIGVGGAVDMWRWPWIAAWLAVTGLVAWRLKKAKSPVLWMVALSLVAFGFGAGSESRLEFARPAPGSIAAVAAEGGRHSIEGDVVHSPEHREEGLRLIVEARRILLDAEAYVPTSGRVALTVREGDSGFRRGDRLRFTARLKAIHPLGNPGSFRIDRYFRQEGVRTTAFVSRADAVEIVSRDHAPGREMRLDEVRAGVGSFIDRKLPDPERRIVRALVLGESAALPDEVRNAYRDAGVSHILAISGMHMSVVGGLAFAFFFWALRSFPRLPLRVHTIKGAAGLTLLPVIGYAALAGGGYSVQRAALMIGVYLAAVLIDRQRDVLSAVALAAILILVATPDALYNIGFQLSFAAVTAIVVIVPRYSRWRTARRTPVDRAFPTRRTRLIDAFLLGLATTVAATWATTPLTAYHFNGFATYAVFANPLIVPIYTLGAVPLALGSVVLAPVSDFVAGGLLSVVRGLIFISHRMCLAWADLPRAYWRVPAPNLVEIAAWYLAPAGFLVFRNRRRAWATAGGAVFLTLISVVVTTRAAASRDVLRLGVIDVGQGLAQLIEMPDGRRVLADGGGHWGSGFDVGERIVAPYLWNRRVFRLDRVVASHPDADHYGGLTFILRHFDVGELWVGEFDDAATPSMYVEMIEAAQARGVPVRRVSAADEPEAFGPATLQILWPPAGQAETLGDNAASLVLKATYGRTAFLLPGDATAEAEAAMLNSVADVEADVLAPAHHGANDATSAAYLDAVDPRWAIVSAGRGNRFGHPAPETLRRLADTGVTVLRTDRDGLVTCESDGIDVRCRGSDVPDRLY